MTGIFLSIAPIFALIILGHLLRRGGIPNLEFWNLNDRLVYWVLLPALLFYKTSTLNLTPELVGSYATVILGALFCAIAFSLGAARLLRMPSQIASSVLQGSTRHNMFIALAVAEHMYGADGLALAVLATALLIPVTNISVVTLMVVLVRQPEDGGIVKSILKDLARNPLLLSVAFGLSINMAGIGEIPVVHEMARILGAAALPIVLLCVGANIRVRAMATATVPVLVSSFGKMVLFPTVIVVLSQLMGLSELETFVAVLFGAVPTASSSYTLARQLSGDAPLMAAIATIQTGLAFVTLPVTVLLVQRLMG